MVKIYVSGGFTVNKILGFESKEVPVDGYGVGSSILGHNKGDEDGMLNSFDFTADVVEVDGKPQAKVGRQLNPNPRLQKVL